MARWIWTGVLVTAIAMTGVTLAGAQTIGTFRWQQQPYCNVITVTVVQTGAIYQLDGFDDQCGAATRAAVTGLAFANPNGTIGMGLTIVTSPGGMPLHVDASFGLVTLSGTWRDSRFGTGAWTFTPGAAPAGIARPAAQPEAPFKAAWEGVVALGQIVPFGGGCMQFGTSGIAGMYLALPVPSGAVLTGVRVRTLDASSSQRITFTLTRGDFVDGVPVASADLDTFTSAVSGPRVTTRTFPGSPASASTIFQLAAQAPAHTGTLLFCGAQPIYTTP